MTPLSKILKIIAHTFMFITLNKTINTCVVCNVTLSTLRIWTLLSIYLKNYSNCVDLKVEPPSFHFHLGL